IEPASDTRARVGVDTCCTPELKVLFDPNNAISAPPPIAASTPITSSRPPSTNSTTRLAMVPPPSYSVTMARRTLSFAARQDRRHHAGQACQDDYDDQGLVRDAEHGEPLALLGTDQRPADEHPERQ